MSLQEHDNNQYTKEKDEVEKYLLRIIQRYFDIENNYTKESIEAIIVESLTRFKQIVIKEKGFIFSLNQKTGHLVLTIKDFSGEYAFDKNSAFNKDFGTVAETICEGNDIRLEDPRDPLEHSHDIGDVNGLKDTLDAFDLSQMHVHNNIGVLNMLQYTGTATAIDLVIIDNLQTMVNTYCENLLYHKEEIANLNAEAVRSILSYRTIINNEFQTAITLINGGITWLDEAKKYTDLMLKQHGLNIEKELLSYMTMNSYNELMNHFNQGKTRTTQGEFSITDGSIMFTSHQDYTAMNEFKETRFNTGIANATIKLFFRYEDENGLTVTVPLPYASIHECGGRVVIQGAYSDDGEIIVTSNFLNTAPFPITRNNFYGTEKAIVVCDNLVWYDNILEELESKHASLCIVNDSAEMAFVQSLLTDGQEYFIHGCNGDPSDPEAPYYDYHGNEVPYLDFDEGQPVLSFANYLIINGNRKMATAVITQQYGYVAQYEVKRLTQYINNPRIMYQVLT